MPTGRPIRTKSRGHRTGGEKFLAFAAKARQLLEVPGSNIDAEALRLAVERAQNRIRVAQMNH